MFLTAALSIFIAAQGVLAEKPASYHDRLITMCEERAGDACCRASARAMRKEQARLFNEKQGCPSGTERTSLACPASYSWCSRDKNNHKGRLEDLSKSRK